ncbi:hypothetical protein [Thermoleptolyngbya sp. M55_K2018_002]|uniref:hypothetical protein n=1 Tax=Thermoleptolyngbya sp. M55_K2018_002 TaxID=2747808 RepID=UPI0019ED9894|nr:hypothetical protein [Thermoleptolyngbya sp. M55_K2018_002]HIK40415.1 hypothetical protein [Thermoleptolyngbya sp. M55_K2018_002]
MKSLTSFCKDHDLPKATVYRDCQKLGIDVSQGLTPDAIARLKFEYNIEDSQEPKPVASPAEVVPDGFVRPGSLAAVNAREIQLPEGFDASQMVRFFDGIAGDSTDTAKLVAIADLALNAVNTVMDGKLQQQREQLTQAERDAKALADKIAAAKTDLKVKALESRMLAERQTSATQSAEALFDELMTMGKPAEGGSSQP